MFRLRQRSSYGVEAGLLRTPPADDIRDVIDLDLIHLLERYVELAVDLRSRHDELEVLLRQIIDEFGHLVRH